METHNIICRLSSMEVTSFKDVPDHVKYKYFEIFDLASKNIYRIETKNNTLFAYDKNDKLIFSIQNIIQTNSFIHMLPNTKGLISSTEVIDKYETKYTIETLTNEKSEEII